MTPAGFEATIPASEWPQTHTLDRVATRIGWAFTTKTNIQCRPAIYRWAVPQSVPNRAPPVKIVASRKFLNKIPLNSGYQPS